MLHTDQDNQVMSIQIEAVEIPESPNNRRGRSGSTVSVSSVKSKQGGSKAQRKSSSLPGEAVEYLKAWMMSPDHVAHPYPTEQEKALIMEDTGIELKQLTNWFVNNRKRYWKPRVEAKLQQQVVAVATTTVTPARLVSLSCSQEAPPPKPPSFSLSLAITQANESTKISFSPPVTPAQQFVRTAFVETSETLSKYVPSTSPLRSVSVVSTSCSESGNMSDSNSAAGDSTVSEGTEQGSDVIERTETVDVHVLRPICFLGKTEDKPRSIEDITILPNVPAARIIRSYRNVTLMYNFPKHNDCDRKKVQARRDAEVVRIKKHYLKLYLSDCSTTDLLAMKSMPMKRKRVEEVEDVAILRRKFSQPSPSLFREVCTTANHVYDMGLPSLEEATFLFGYAQ